MVDEALRGVGTDLVWSLDGRYLYYTRLDEAWRPHEIWRHELGTDPAGDVRLLEESDERFWLGISSSRDDRWLIAGAGSKTTRRCGCSTCPPPTRSCARRAAPRGRGVLRRGRRGPAPRHPQCRLPGLRPRLGALEATSHEEWQPCGVRAASERILGVEAFTSFSALSLRKDGLTAIRILRTIPISQPVSVRHTTSFRARLCSPSRPAPTLESETSCIQVVTESLVSPRAVWDVDVVTGEWTLLRRQPVLGGYDPQDYEQHREWASRRTAPACRSRWSIGAALRATARLRDCSWVWRLRGAARPVVLGGQALAYGPRARRGAGPRPRRRRAGPGVV